jgi:hypothetical protein
MMFITRSNEEACIVLVRFQRWSIARTELTQLACLVRTCSISCIHYTDKQAFEVSVTSNTAQHTAYWKGEHYCFTHMMA